MNKMEATIALAGNPNSGKTTLFNALTGARQHVGNYPGVTVDKKEGTYIFDGQKLNVVDLPGTYSLTAYSLEETVARDFLVQEKPQVVVNIVDASNLERNLYLTLQFMELGVPVCLALNMIDVAETRGITIDVDKLSDALGIPIVSTVARTGKGKDRLIAAAQRIINGEQDIRPLAISYGEDIDKALMEMTKIVESTQFLSDQYPARWVALKYIENDEQILKRGRSQDAKISDQLDSIVTKVAQHIKNTFDSYPEAVIADQRYGYIKSLLKDNVITHRKDPNRLYISDKMDNVLTNRLAGPLIMLAIIFGLYHFTFTYSEMPVGWLEGLFGWIGAMAERLLPEGLLKSMIISGVIDGVGGVLGFVPLIMFMFLGIAFLEDSGYMARMAYMLDRVFRVFGLHGSSVMAFIVSGGIAGGCAVPGVMATRTLKSRKERLATLLTVPFMNCGAKVPIFALLVAAFFTQSEATVMLIITLIAWVGALLAAKFLRMTVVKGDSTPFVMELPPYHLPTFKGLAIHTWERTWRYVKKAGTVILGISIILWALMTFPQLPESKSRLFSQAREKIMATASPAVIQSLETGATVGTISEDVMRVKVQLNKIDMNEAEAALKNSVAGRIGTALESVSRFAGFDWHTNIALVGGFAAKEVVVSTLGTAYSLGEVDPEESESLSSTLATAPGWRPLTAMSLIVFIIFYAPCFVTVVCIVREAGSWKWGAFSVVFNTLLAFTLSVIVYQAGSAMGF